MGYVLEVTSGSDNEIIHPIISILLFIIDKPNDYILGNIFIGACDGATFVYFFEGGHHRYTDEYPFSTECSYALSIAVDRVMCCMLAMAFSCTDGSLYSVFDIEECDGVEFTYFIEYFKVVTM